MITQNPRNQIKSHLENLIGELEDLYILKFEELVEFDMKESQVARLCQLLLQSRDSAISPLKEELERQRHKK